MSAKVISFSSFPELPAPWISDNAGEGYEWGDYYLALQHNPSTIADFTKSVLLRKSVYDVLPTNLSIRYCYALLVFCRDEKNPDRINFHRPCEVLTIEQSKDFKNDSWHSPCFCSFTPDLHVFISDFDEDINIKNVKRCFFDYLHERIPGGPIKVGTLEDLRKLKRMKKNRNSGFINTFRSFSDRQKIFFGFGFVSVIVLIIALCDQFDSGFYVFLRIVTCTSLVGLIVDKLPVWVKFPALLLAILYNPILPIHLDDRDLWAFFNVITIPVLTIPWFFLLRRKSKSLPERND